MSAIGSGAPSALRAARDRGRQRALVTPEGITIPVLVAGRGARFWALFFDLAFIAVLIVATTIALLQVAGGVADAVRRAEQGSAGGSAMQFLMILWIVMMFLFRNAYFLFFELGPRGATLGKRICGIRIAARDGGRLSAEMVIARNLFRDIELFMPLVFIASAGADSGWAWLTAIGWLLIFMLMPLFNRDRLRAGDIIAGTWVLERPLRRLETALSLHEKSPAVETEREYRFTETQLEVYGEFELQALERVLRDARGASIEAVYQTIAAKIERNDGWNDERRFLEAYYTQLRARLEAGMRMGRRKADKHSESAR